VRVCTDDQGSASTENLPEETYGHINSAFRVCDGMATTSDGMATTGTDAYHFIWRVSEEICMPACKLHKHQRVSSGLSQLIKESSMSTLWQEEEFE